jgi:hypothetical protein
MKQTINFNQFVDAFNNAGRQGQFSYEALQAIFEHIEDLERDTGEETELDVVGICCYWSEESPEEIASQYDVDLSDCDDEDAIADAVEEHLQCETHYVKLDNGNFVYVQY